MGCPEMTLKEIAELAVRRGVWGVELRGKSADEHISPMTSKEDQVATRLLYRNLGLHIAGIASYVKFADDDMQEENTDELERFADLGAYLGAEYIRVFYGEGFDTTEARIAEGIAVAAEAIRPYNIKLLLEMSDELKTSEQALRLLSLAGNPENVGVIFDTYTPFKELEDPVASFRALEKKIGAIHLNAYRTDEKGHHHQCLPSESGLPMEPLFEEIAKSRIDVPAIIMWERLFDESLCEMDEAIENYRRCLIL